MDFKIVFSYTILFITSLSACVVACGSRPLNRVPPKTEVIYSKDNPCDRKPNSSIQDELDSSEDQEFTYYPQPNPAEFGPAYEGSTAADMRVGKGEALDEAPVLYAPRRFGGEAYYDPGTGGEEQR